MRPKWFNAFAVAVISAVVLGACTTQQPGSGSSPTAAARQGGTFRYGQSGDAAALDPWNVTDGNSLQITEQIFESLVAYKPQTFEIVPNLADSWTTSSDKTQWTFKLHPGIKFTDGTDFDADAVVFNFDRARNTKFQYRNSKPVADDYGYYSDMWGGFDGDSRHAESTRGAEVRDNRCDARFHTGGHLRDQSGPEPSAHFPALVQRGVPGNKHTQGAAGQARGPQGDRDGHQQAGDRGQHLRRAGQARDTVPAQGSRRVRRIRGLLQVQSGRGQEAVTTGRRVERDGRPLVHAGLSSVLPGAEEDRRSLRL